MLEKCQVMPSISRKAFTKEVCHAIMRVVFGSMRGICMQSIQFDKFRDKITAIFKKNDVKRAGLFGSFARGEAKRNSDIDILIEFKGKKSLFDLVDLKDELENSTGRSVDLVTYKSLHPLLRKKILSEQIIIL